MQRIVIEKLICGGAGAGDLDGKFVFVPSTVPGDIVDIEVKKDHGTWVEASLVNVAEPSKARVVPRCPVFGKCGGCDWQHISYDAQLEWKRAILVESLRRIAKIESPEVLPTVRSPKEWNYRNRIQLHVDSRGKVGFYRPKSKEVVEFDECLIADERLNAILNEKRAEFGKRDRGVALRAEDGPSFSQVNELQNEQLKTKVIEWLAEIPNGDVLELYAGAGNFTFAIAAVAGRIVASDVDGRAIAFAKERQFKEGAGNIEFLCSPSARAASRMRGRCDVVLVDPPRKGCADALMDIVKLQPGHILYISCDPATLSRDTKALADSGYSFVRSLPVDMFPQTHHIESLTLLRRN
jgi:tRNA/tmRNA/rRNA uracil-C5-methylase (TrmA/RlmC/RlmD family)